MTRDDYEFSSCFAPYIKGLIQRKHEEGFLFNSAKTDPYFTVSAIVVCLAPIVCYFVLQDYVTIKDVKRYEAANVNVKINIILTVILFPILFALKCLFTGYSVADCQLGKMALLSLIPFAVLAVVFFLVCREYKKFKSCIFTFAIAALAFCPSFIYKVNSAFDFSPAETVVCEVLDMYTSGSGENAAYRLVVRYQNKELKVEVSEAAYNAASVGNTLSLVRRKGALGIQTVYLPGEER